MCRIVGGARHAKRLRPAQIASLAKACGGTTAASATFDALKGVLQPSCRPYSAAAEGDIQSYKTSELPGPQTLKKVTRQSSTAGTSDAGKRPPQSPAEKSAQLFENLGLNANLSRQVITSFPHMTSPTTTQKAVVKAMRKPCDVVLRAHTGTGKSFGILLALLSMPRLTLMAEGGSVKRRAVSSILVVPSRELALQYEYWMRQLFPEEIHGSLSKILSARYRTSALSADEHIRQLEKETPHILVITATLLEELLGKPRGGPALGVATLRALVLDEADALLDLPNRFPSHKQIWKHQKHPPAGLAALNYIMRHRATCSGGTPLPSSGLETARGADDRSGPGGAVRRAAHQGNDEVRSRNDKDSASPFNKKALVAPLSRKMDERPLQLIVASATANSVLRHFLGARTGWLRTGIRDERGNENGKWIDTTGLSKGVGKADEVVDLAEELDADNTSRWPLQLPRELSHSCIVVDEAVEGEDAGVTWRNLDAGVARRTSGADELHRKSQRSGGRRASPADDEAAHSLAAPATHVVVPTGQGAGTVDTALLTCLAYLFASQGVQRAIALIPPTWSMAKTRQYLEQFEVPVRELYDEDSSTAYSTADAEEAMYVMHSTAARGLDVPGGVSHVFNVGVDCVRDTTLYTHLAGRAARIGRHASGYEENARSMGSGSGPGQSAIEADLTAMKDRKTVAVSNSEPQSHSQSTRTRAQAHARAPGTVITLVRGLSTAEVRHNRRRRTILRRRFAAHKGKQVLADDDEGQDRRNGMADSTEALDLTSTTLSASLPPPTQTPSSSTPIPADRRIVASSELKMALVFRRLNVRPQPVDHLRQAEPLAEQDAGLMAATNEAADSAAA